MLKRAASHLKGMATGFVNNAISGVASGFSSGFGPSISGNQAKVAAELLKKSPLETDFDPKEKLNSDPLQFSYIQYPLDLTQNELGHYILFYAIANKFDNATEDLMIAGKMGNNLNLGTAQGDFDEGVATVQNFRQLKDNQGNVIKPLKSENSVLSQFPTHTQTTAAIALYMPPGVKVSYGMSYTGAKETDLSGTIATALGKAKSAESTAASVKSIIQGAAGAGIDIGKKLIDSVGESLEIGSPGQLFSKAFGVAINPHEEQFFEKPNFRSFDYNFEFYPRNKEEMRAVQNIIFLFKYHMHPRLDKGSGGRLFKVPSEFEIHYAHLGQQNSYLNKIARCVLKGMDVTYGPEEQFSTFKPDEKGAAPVTTKISLSFEETTFITKDQIYEGF